MFTINQTAESKDLFGAELGEKLLDGLLGDAIVLDFITDKFFLTAGLVGIDCMDSRSSSADDVTDVLL
jgi:hypothetical protein